MKMTNTQITLTRLAYFKVMVNFGMFALFLGLMINSKMVMYGSILMIFGAILYEALSRKYGGC